MRILSSGGILVSAFALLVAGCGGGGGGGGATTARFVTADPRGMTSPTPTLPGGDGENGGGNVSVVEAPGAPATDAAGEVAKEIAEADVAKVDGDYLVLVNAWRGLAVVDLATVTVVGRLSLDGIPQELFLRDGHAVVLGVSPDGATTVTDVSLAVPTAPSLLTTLSVAGWYRTARVVGTTLHVVTEERAASCALAPSLASLGSTALPEPAAFVAASDALLCVSGYGNGLSTTFTLVGISASGAPVVRSTFSRPGWVGDDRKLDLYGSVLRLVTHDAADGAVSHLFTVSVADPAAPVALGSLDLARGEQTFATCFDGPRAYVVTFEQVDPLWVIDLDDPANPTVAGFLVVPGWSTQLVPTGDGRLVGLGTDPAAGWATTVSLFDVSTPAFPTLVDREAFGNAWSPANGDRKALGVFPAEGLVTVPLSGFEDSLAVIDVTPVGLSIRGTIPMAGSVVRGFPHPRGLVGVSTEEVVVANPGTLAAIGRATIAENVVDACALPDGRVLSLLASRAGGRLGDATIPLSPERLYPVGAKVAVVGWDDLGRGAYVVDFSGPTPVLSARFDLGSAWFVLSDPAWRSFGPLAMDGPWIGGGGAASDALLTPDGRLVVHGVSSANGPAPTPGIPGQKAPPLFIGDGVLDGFLVLDIPNARMDAPIEVADAYVTGFCADDTGGLLYTVAGPESSDGAGRPRMRHDLVRVELSTREASAPVNVPGYVLAARGGLVYTAEETWTAGWSTELAIVASRLGAPEATEAGRIALPQGAYDLRVAGATLFFTSWDGAGWITGGGGGVNGFAPEVDLGELLPTSSIGTVRLAELPTAGPTIASDRFVSLLLPEEGGALVVEDGTNLVRYDLTGATAVAEWTRALSTWPLLARADDVNGGWLVALGYAGLLTAP